MLILVVLATFAFSTGTLTKPSERQGNIINGKEIANVYNLLKGDSTYSDISINGAVFSETGNITVDTLTVSVTVADTTLTTLTADSVITGAVTVSGNSSFADSMSLDALAKIFLDGGGDTYIHEQSANDFEIVVGATVALKMENGVGTTFSTDAVTFGGSATVTETLIADSLNVSGISILKATDVDGAFTAGTIVSDAGVSGTTGTFSGDFSVADTLSVVGGFIAPTQTPSSSSDTGTLGQMSWDASYIYICTATDVWERVAIATW